MPYCSPYANLSSKVPVPPGTSWSLEDSLPRKPPALLPLSSSGPEFTPLLSPPPIQFLFSSNANLYFHAFQAREAENFVCWFVYHISNLEPVI